MGMRGIVTLGVATNPPPVWPDVRLTLEYGIPPLTVMGGMVMTTVVIVVKKAVVTTPLGLVVGPMWPYSNEVVYSPASMVVGLDRGLVGSTSTAGPVPDTIEAVQTSVPT
jgi:hypothetical protein